MTKTPVPYAKPLFFPEEFDTGPWGVDTIGDMWAVINKLNSRNAVIGPVRGLNRRMRVNHFDRAMTEAATRNRKHWEKELERIKNFR